MPFLWGMAAATVAILLVAAGGTHRACRGAAGSIPSVLAPPKTTGLSVVEQDSVKGGFFARWRENRRLKREPVQTRTSGGDDDLQCMLPLLDNPKIGACQIYWNGLNSLGLSSFVPNNAWMILNRSSKSAGESVEVSTDQGTAIEVVSSKIDRNIKSVDIDASGDQIDLDVPPYEEKYNKAVTPTHIPLSPSQKDLISKLDANVKSQIPYWEARANKVYWGAATQSLYMWYKKAVKRALPTSTDLETLDGGPLYYSYLRIMKWPSNLYAYVMPFKTCGKKGCDSYVALEHSLKFREVYKPWLISKSAIEENSNGCVYHRGYTPSFGHPPTSGHSLVWVRPGQCKPKDYVATIRSYVHTLERAISDSLKHSGGRVGKMNVIIDGAGISFGSLPPLKAVKTIVTMLQDHFPDRLGLVLLTNLGTAGEMMLKLFMPLLTKEVREKIHILSHRPDDRQGALETVIGKDNIPTWLGGSDAYQFDASKYYPSKLICSEETARAYITEMPYHA